MPRQKNSSQPTAIYNRFVGRNIDFEELVYQAKKLVMTIALATEWNVLANRLSQIAEAQPKTRDYTLNALRDAFLYNALAQTLLLLTSPGVPDIYQGNEIWCFSLVDPDNRRPVDFEIGRQLLLTIDDALVDDRLSLLKSLLDAPEDGRIKLFLTTQTLRTAQPICGAV
jgi:maltooligosyltrehalose synthase